MSQLKVDSIVPRGGLPSSASGGIIQQKFVNDTTTFTATTHSSFLDLPLTLSITPQSSSNKILVTANITIQFGTTIFVLRLLRGSTNIGTTSETGGFQGLTGGTQDSSRGAATNTIVFLDSPSTTSSTTYKIQCLFQSGTLQYNRRDTDFRACSQMLLQEVGM
tara:strand:- start:763 stop:1251 length:489 start_codon:yes stop_codon:yes gene_type:complete